MERLLREYTQNQDLVRNIGSHYYQIIYPVQLRQHKKMGISTREIGSSKVRTKRSSVCHCTSSHLIITRLFLCMQNEKQIWKYLSHLSVPILNIDRTSEISKSKIFHFFFVITVNHVHSIFKMSIMINTYSLR